MPARGCNYTSSLPFPAGLQVRLDFTSLARSPGCAALLALISRSWNGDILQNSIFCILRDVWRPGARFLKVPVTFRARKAV